MSDRAPPISLSIINCPHLTPHCAAPRGPTRHARRSATTSPRRTTPGLAEKRSRPCPRARTHGGRPSAPSAPPRAVPIGSRSRSAQRGRRPTSTHRALCERERLSRPLARRPSCIAKTASTCVARQRAHSRVRPRLFRRPTRTTAFARTVTLRPLHRCLLRLRLPRPVGPALHVLQARHSRGRWEHTNGICGEAEATKTPAAPPLGTRDLFPWGGSPGGLQQAWKQAPLDAGERRGLQLLSVMVLRVDSWHWGGGFGSKL